MPDPIRNFFILLCLVVTSQCLAKNSTDTTLKSPINTRSRSLPTSTNRAQEIWDGVKSIRSDSVEKGVHQLTDGIKITFVSSKLNRISEYNGIEFVSLLNTLDEGKLSVDEKKLGLEIFKMIFQQKTTPDVKNIDPLLKAVPNTYFVQRFKLLLHHNDEKYIRSLLSDLLRDHPENLSFNILQAETDFEKEKYSEAIKYCDKAIALFPSYSYAYMMKGRCEGRTSKYDQEIQDETAALSYYPKYVEALYYRAAAYEDEDKYRDAANDYNAINVISPGYGYTDYDLGRCYKFLNQLDSTLYFANRYIQEAPEDEDGYDLKGDAYYRKDEYNTAVDWYNQAIKLAPNRAVFYEDRGDAYFYLNKIDTAMIDFQKEASLDKKNTYPLRRIGDCYYAKKDYTNSIIYHQKALKLDPTYKSAWMSLDYCYDALGKHELAIEMCKKVLAIDSTYDSALGDLGWEYYCTGHFDDCITYSYKCLKYNEKATYAMFNIALATLRKGDVDKARELYRHFLSLCKQNSYEITGGQLTDLRDLIKQNIETNEAVSIIEDIFGETP
jgi:tetratricopeptide (TPR) repeat protein